MGTIRIADIDNRYDIEKLIKVMLGDENPDEVARSIVDDFFMNNRCWILV